MQPTARAAEFASFPMCDLPVGGKGTITEFSLPVSAQEYLMRLGFVPGSEVEMVRKLPFHGPVIFRTQGAEIAIRHEVAKGIFVSMAALKEEGTR